MPEENSCFRIAHALLRVDHQLRELVLINFATLVNVKLLPEVVPIRQGVAFKLRDNQIHEGQLHSLVPGTCIQVLLHLSAHTTVIRRHRIGDHWLKYLEPRVLPLLFWFLTHAGVTAQQASTEIFSFGGTLDLAPVRLSTLRLQACHQQLIQLAVLNLAPRVVIAEVAMVCEDQVATRKELEQSYPKRPGIRLRCRVFLPVEILRRFVPCVARNLCVERTFATGVGDHDPRKVFLQAILREVFGYGHPVQQDVLWPDVRVTQFVFRMHEGETLQDLLDDAREKLESEWQAVLLAVSQGSVQITTVLWPLHHSVRFHRAGETL
mmetsp:Transcript_50970/g.135966  ORF Transcript_50970/g.135966 Transcript_50970/m.135966 type:complete len:322 (-) Transcript_50970:1215-2180(-)